MNYSSLRAGGVWWHGRVFCLWFLSVLAGARSYIGIVIGLIHKPLATP